MSDDRFYKERKKDCQDIIEMAWTADGISQLQKLRPGNYIADAAQIIKALHDKDYLNWWKLSDKPGIHGRSCSKCACMLLVDAFKRPGFYGNSSRARGGNVATAGSSPVLRTTIELLILHGFLERGIGREKKMTGLNDDFRKTLCSPDDETTDTNKTAMTKVNALWNTKESTIPEAVEKDSVVKRLTSELATLNIIDEDLDVKAQNIYDKFAETTTKVEELHTAAKTHIDTLQKEIAESSSNITNIYGNINELPSVLTNAQAQQAVASTKYKAARGDTTNRFNDLEKDLENVRASLHSYKVVVDGPVVLHTRAKTHINKLQAELTTAQSAIEKIIDSIKEHSPSLEKLRTELDEAQSSYEAAVTETSKKDVELQAAMETARLANSNEITISEGRRNLKKALIFTMKEGFKFQDWSCDNGLVRPEVEGILCIFVDFPIFFSLVELEALLGCKAGNNNVKIALQKMVEEDMLILKEDHTRTQKYYLGRVARAILENRSIPDIRDARPTGHAKSVQAYIKAGKLHANKIEEKHENDKKRKAEQAVTTSAAVPIVSPDGKEKTAKRTSSMDGDKAKLPAMKNGSSKETALEVGLDEDTEGDSTSEENVSTRYV